MSSPSTSPDSAKVNERTSASTDFRKFFRILIMGCVLWIAAIIGLLMGTEITSEGDLYLAFSNKWYIAAVMAVCALLLLVIINGLVSKNSWKPLLAAFFVFSIPLVVGIGIVRCISYLQMSHLYDIESVIGALLVVFYAAGLIMAYLLRKRDLKEPAIVFLVAPLLGVALISAYQTYEIVTSDQFIYRNAFAIETEQVTYENGVLRIKGKLTINRGGDLGYEATSMFMDFSPEMVSNQGKIEWQGGQPPAEPGVYPLTITWKNVPEQILRAPVHDEFQESYFGLVINRKDEKKKHPVTLRYFALPTRLQNISN